jgi:hypothetical protein
MCGGWHVFSSSRQCFAHLQPRPEDAADAQPLDTQLPVPGPLAIDDEAEPGLDAPPPYEDAAWLATMRILGLPLPQPPAEGEASPATTGAVKCPRPLGPPECLEDVAAGLSSGGDNCPGPTNPLQQRKKQLAARRATAKRDKKQTRRAGRKAGKRRGKKTAAPKKRAGFRRPMKGKRKAARRALEQMGEAEAAPADHPPPRRRPRREEPLGAGVAERAADPRSAAEPLGSGPAATEAAAQAAGADEGFIARLRDLGVPEAAWPTGPVPGKHSYTLRVNTGASTASIEVQLPMTCATTQKRLRAGAYYIKKPDVEQRSVSWIANGGAGPAWAVARNRAGESLLGQ